jgi:short-subunit dehydrogenase
MNLQGKHIILTGAASGIGAALLRDLSQTVAHITCADVNSAALQATIAALPSHKATITPFVGDLSMPSTVDDLVTAALAAMGSIDVFIANAGFAYYERMDYHDWQRIEKIFALNTFSPIYTAQVLQARLKNPYTLVMLASAMSFIAVPGYSLYAATKAALDRFAEGYRQEKPAHVSLMVVYPVATRTNFFRGAGKDVPTAPPSQTPEYVARAIINGLKNDKNKVFPSHIFRWSRFTAIGLQTMRWFTYLVNGRLFREWLAKQPESK